MDPNETLAEILTALKMEDEDAGREIVIDRCRDLADWLENGGFIPSLNEALFRSKMAETTAT